MYDEKYCEKHKQPYAGYLFDCPICLGEILGGTLIVRINGEVKMYPEPDAPDALVLDENGNTEEEAYKAFF